jgi:hypothetical protein
MLGLGRMAVNLYSGSIRSAGRRASRGEAHEESKSVSAMRKVKLRTVRPRIFMYV